MYMPPEWGCIQDVLSLFLSEKGISNGTIMLCTLGQEEQTNWIDVSYALFPDGATPRFVVPTNSSTETPQKDDFILFWGSQ